jgi:hypothetical protein
VSNTKYITRTKAEELTRGYINCMNFIYWEIVNNKGDMELVLKPGRWIVMKHYLARPVFLKVEKDMTLTEYYVKEDET